MPRFRYTARKPSGESVVDYIDAESTGVVAKRISAMGLIPVGINEEKDRGTTGFLERVSPAEVIMFTRQLVTLYKAGLPFLSSLDVIGKQTGNQAMQRVVMIIRSDVESGMTLSAALAKHPKVFSEVYVATVMAGEAGGVLADVMSRLVDLLENEAETRRAVKTALRYPVTVVCCMLAAFGVIVTCVIPSFAKMFSKFGANLPFPTRVLMLTNDVRRDYWHIVLILLVAGIFAFVWGIRTKPGRAKFDAFILNLPLLGSIIMKASMARLAHMFGTLSDSGLPILRELNVIARTIGNVKIASQIESVQISVQEGSTLGAAIDSKTSFPPLVKHMVAVGEKTGAMSDMMRAVAQHYDRETKVAIASLTQAIEPLVTVVLGAALLFLAMAVFLPMWDMMRVMGK